MVGREALGAYVGGLLPLWGPMLAVLAALGPYVGPMLIVLGSMLAVLGRSRGLCWRSWAALRAYVGGLGSGSGPKLAVLGPKWSVLEAIRAKSGPNPSGKAIWQADQGGKVAQTRAGRPFWGGDCFVTFSGRRDLKRIFSYRCVILSPQFWICAEACAAYICVYIYIHIHICLYVYVCTVVCLSVCLYR